tara:strand:+ start:267 stop:458 length:192 start_codon:yes stop_codon:yes gene_type:complete
MTHIELISSGCTANTIKFEDPDFQGMLDGKFQIPEHLRSECIEIIKRIDEQKLKTVKVFLMTF